MREPRLELFTGDEGAGRQGMVEAVAGQAVYLDKTPKFIGRLSQNYAADRYRVYPSSRGPNGFQLGFCEMELFGGRRCSFLSREGCK